MPITYAELWDDVFINKKGWDRNSRIKMAHLVMLVVGLIMVITTTLLTDKKNTFIELVSITSGVAMYILCTDIIKYLFQCKKLIRE